MPRLTPNTACWNGRGGHYEVWYLTLTDGGSGVGVWIRYTMTAPDAHEPPSAALWFVAIDPRRGVLARKAIRAISDLHARAEPFELRIGDALLTDERMAGGFGDVSWDVRWTASGSAYRHVHPIAERLGLAQRVLVLPHADLTIDGAVAFAGEQIELQGARGGQAHIWGSKHADSWPGCTATTCSTRPASRSPARSSTPSRFRSGARGARSGRSHRSSGGSGGVISCRSRRCASRGTGAATRSAGVGSRPSSGGGS